MGVDFNPLPCAKLFNIRISTLTLILPRFRKKKRKDKQKTLETVMKAPIDSSSDDAAKKPLRTKTKAELAFEKQREKNVSMMSSLEMVNPVLK